MQGCGSLIYKLEGIFIDENKPKNHQHQKHNNYSTRDKIGR